MNEPQKFALIKLDKVEVTLAYLEKLFPLLKEDKAKIIEKYKVGDIIKMLKWKDSSFGCFKVNVN